MSICLVVSTRGKQYKLAGLRARDREQQRNKELRYIMINGRQRIILTYFASLTHPEKSKRLGQHTIVLVHHLDKR